jgi:hypothetical protein
MRLSSPFRGRRELFSRFCGFSGLGGFGLHLRGLIGLIASSSSCLEKLTLQK